MRILTAIGNSISTVLIYLGLPLLGWGVRALAGFFSAAPRTTFAAAIVVFGLAVGYQSIIAPEGIQGSPGDRSKLVRRQTVVGYGLVLLLFGALVFLPYADRRSLGVLGAHAAAQWLGVGCCTLGAGLIFWSGLALENMYSAEVTLQKEHRLITSGLYGAIRHPRYLGNILLFLGLTLLFRSWMGLAAAPVFLGLLAVRIRDEEVLMRREFGEAWEAYCRRSRRLIPLVF